MRFPEIEAIADVNRVERQLVSEGCAIAISRWAETAMEVARDRTTSIRHHYVPYRELSELGELTIERALLFVNGLLEKLPSQAARERLIFVQLAGVQ